MLSTTGIHYSRPNSQQLHPSHPSHPSLHQNQGGVNKEWNRACHSANNSSIVSTDTPSYPYHISPISSSITTTALSPFGRPSSTTPSSPYPYSPSQTPTPTPSTIITTSSTSLLPASSSLSSSSTQGSHQSSHTLQDIANARPPDDDDNDEYRPHQNYYSPYNPSPNPPKLSSRLQALHAQLGTSSSRIHHSAEMASIPTGVENSPNIANPRPRVFGGWLSGKPRPTTPPSVNGEEGSVPQPRSSLSLPSPGLSPDSITDNLQAPRRLPPTGKGPSASPSESVTPRNPSPAAPNSNRLSMLQSSISAITWLSAPTATSEAMDEGMDNDEDELLHLDIDAALYPGGFPTESFSAAAFKNLQVNALALAQKLHSAYRTRTMAIRTLEEERDSQKEDLIEARARALRLKQQVESMTKQATEQERSMMELMNELAAEKRARISEKDEREKNLNMVPESSESKRADSFSEDLGVDDEEGQRQWRTSAGTIRSDVSFDTDEESTEADSIFSRSRSPTTPSTYQIESTATTPIQAKGPISLGPQKSRSSLQMSAFQKILKGITKTEEEDGCRNCKGQNASVAWNTVSLLRDENKALKSRVGDLEGAVESAMDIVNGVGM